MMPITAPTPIPIFAPVLSWLLLFDPLLELPVVCEEAVWVVTALVCDDPESIREDVEAEFVAIEAPVPDVMEDIDAEFLAVKELLLYVAAAAPDVTCV
jgi:hypothetical protein